MPESDKNHYCLDKLIGFVGNDPDAIKNMVNLFLSTTPDLLQSINSGFHEGKAENLAKAAHTLKPTLDVFGVEDTYDLIRSIEQKAKRSELDAELGKHIEQLNTTMELVFQELKLAYLET